MPVDAAVTEFSSVLFFVAVVVAVVFVAFTEFHCPAVELEFLDDLTSFHLGFPIR